MATVRMIQCLSCLKIKPHKSRYLCLACYQHPKAQKFKIKTKFRVDREDKNEALKTPTKLPEKPTNHPPGSPEKIEVMRLRWINNTHIHHPDDVGLVPSEMK
jgi:hypothetical protein